MQDPMVSFSIFSSVTLTHAAQFTTVTEGLDFIRRLLLAFLFGFAIAIAVSLFILPITSRRDLFKDTVTYAQAIRDVFKAHTAYVQVVQDLDPQQLAKASETAINTPSEEEQATSASSRAKVATQETINFNLAMAALVGVHDKMAADLALAESEVAWGKLTGADLRQILTHFRSIMLPLSGMSTLPIISQRLPHDRRKAHQMPLIHDQWKLFLKSFLKEMEDSADLVMLGIQHAIIVLGIASQEAVAQLTEHISVPKDNDVEKSVQALLPGDPSFASCFETELQGRYNRYRGRGRSGSQARTVTVSHHTPSTTFTSPDKNDEEAFKVLFLEHLMQFLRQSAQDLVTFADREGTETDSKHDRLLLPQGWTWKLSWSASPHDGSNTRARDGKASTQPRRDPEHLPATNLWERWGEKVGLLLHILASDQSVFGFRAAAAPFSVGLLAYLRQTQNFFFEQRLIWVRQSPPNLCQLDLNIVKHVQARRAW